MVDRRGGRVVRERVVELGRLLLAGEAADGADGRELHVAHAAAVEVELHDLVLRILQIGGKQVAADRRDPFEQRRLMLRNDGLDPLRAVQVDAAEGIVHGVAVGHIVEGVVLHRDGGIVGIEALEQRAELLLGASAVEHLRAGGTLRRKDKEPLAVLRGPGPEVAQRVLAVLVDEAVGRLRRTERMVVDLLILVLRRIDASVGRLIAAVVEAFGVGSPLGAGVLHPADFVGGQLARRGILDADLDPVRARCGGRIGEVAPVLRERRRGQRHRPVLRKGVRIEEDLARRARLLRAVEHRLILQAVVIIVVPPVAVLDRRPLLGIVPQFGQPLADRTAEGDLREVVLRHGILGRHPGSRRLRIVILEPAVGIGHLGAEIVVHDPAALGFGVGHPFYLLHVAAGCCKGRHAREQGGGGE